MNYFFPKSSYFCEVPLAPSLTFMISLALASSVGLLEVDTGPRHTVHGTIFHWSWSNLEKHPNLVGFEPWSLKRPRDKQSHGRLSDIEATLGRPSASCMSTRPLSLPAHMRFTTACSCRLLPKKSKLGVSDYMPTYLTACLPTYVPACLTDCLNS